MSFWKREKRRRKSPAHSRPVESMPTVGRTLYGKRVVRIGDPDLFAQEDAMRVQAQSALDPEDESHAQGLIDLLGQYAGLDATDRQAAETIDEAIKVIGRRLCENGGSNRMKLIAFRVAALNPGNPYASVRSMESFWNGICGWQV
jgi:hypothetical protein